MAKGIIYCMTTIVPGLVKIGKTGLNNYESRMYNLERNGYVNVVGLKRRFAIAVNDYDEKEALLQEIFSKSNIPNSELFAIDIELVVQLLSSFEGEQVYPETITKDEVFDTATEERISANSVNKYNIPQGEYHLDEVVREFGRVTAAMVVRGRKFVVKKGSKCLPCDKDWMPEARRNANTKNGILQEDVECNSPSTAGWIVLGRSNNGWKLWKNAAGEVIDIYRMADESEE